MIHRRSCLVCITYTSALTMGNASRQSRQVIPPIRRWCTTVSTELSKSINQLWTTYLLTRNPWLVSSVQLLMNSSHVLCKRHELNAQSMSIYQNDSKGIIKSNFVSSCLAFRGSIPINSIYLIRLWVLVHKEFTYSG